ncbi:glycine betaine transporter OpuD [Oxobacter pfennigii]|uniref:Glycine betaine transporter OpuD n=1 Tax=Oxobacter pfennigii TaxID=36849 RepID=A0A0P8W8J0_9CLOT|nr:BCCT family transporter [Oxobacter pfennigii]KPU44318.1 glycine betaine transporter OpuD [Oxobacter pfennigii]
MKNKNSILSQLDWPLIILPLIVVVALCAVFMVSPEGSTQVMDSIRGFLSNELGFFYILSGLGILLITLYVAFSSYGKIRLGNLDKPQYTDFQWATMIFTGVFAADIVFYSFIEWALYAAEPRIEQLGGIQDWAATYPLFHWGPIPWAFYVVLAVAFGFSIHVRGRSKQKFSEACRPLLGNSVDKAPGKIIDLIAIIALIAGTATTFSLATPLLASALSRVFGFEASTALTVVVLGIIAAVYTISVLSGMEGIIKSASICTVLFLGMLAYFLFVGGQTRYIIETGITSIGNLMQNFIGLSTWMDPLRESGDGTFGFVQNWTIFYWAYWMAWCVATPFFIGMISKGRTIKNVILGTYGYGIMGTFLSFIIFGNYGLSQQLAGKVDIIGMVQDGMDINQGIIQIFETLPMTEILLIILFVMMVLFYSTTFDSLTLVISAYSYKNLPPGEEAARPVRAFWAIMFIIFPIGLIFAENSINSLQSVSIIAAFPIGIVFYLIIASFFKDAKKYLEEQKNI